MAKSSISIWSYTAGGEWNFIPVKQGSDGAGKVTPEYAKQVINDAVDTWRIAGLTDEQIAFGIALMDVES